MIDLHVHSAYSDGTESPRRLVELAVAAKLSALALTDHDNTNGQAEFLTAAAEVGLRAISGVELSLRDPRFPRPDGRDRSVHVLAYFVTLDEESPFQRLVREMRRDREARNRELIARLVAEGFTRLNYDEVVSRAERPDSLGRPHIANAMMELHPELVGDATTEHRQRIFDEWLGSEGRVYVERQSPSIDTFTRATAGSGIVYSVAHPHLNYRDRSDAATLETDLAPVLATLAERGVRGVESYYGSLSEPLRRRLVKATRDAGLIPTGGSDFHGANRVGIELGRGLSGDLRVPDEILDELIAAR